mmetsp:Transcript_70634/g.86643  ORF Transcript_70634/g.86643 Transcript_70634/m.86643 type:complete len:285 (+) Transcript_70634:60-914(+)
MLRINISFPSGHTQSLSLPHLATVRDLKILAQKSLGKGFLKLVTDRGDVLANVEDTLAGAGIQEGDYLTAIAQQPQLVAARAAFALWCCGGNKVVTWGLPEWGGDSSAVQDRLKNVQQVQAGRFAFSAILADGSVVTWGHLDYGRDSSAAQDHLNLNNDKVQQIHATPYAFAAILADGSVVSWGDPEYGGDSSAVQDQLKNVQQVQATERAFATIRADGSVVAWGDREYGGDSSRVQHQLTNVQQVHATARAFAAILADGSVVTWGHPSYGGDSSVVQDQLLCM